MLCVTVVLLERKSLPFLIAAFMFFSITLMLISVVCLYVLIIMLDGANGSGLGPVYKVAH